MRWHEDDISRSITLYSTGAKMYKFLRRKGFPLPAVRTLQSWASRLDISPGIIEPVMQILSAASPQLDDVQKICVLSFDEMKIRNAYCYDKPSDTLFAPVNYVQVAMLRGLFSKWKQPVFYNFDCKMTKVILHDIISSVQACGYYVAAVVSDLGGPNRGLYTTLDVKPDTPWFLHNDKRIYVFADAPHLIKLERNHYLDQGFEIDGKEVKKDTIVDLLSCTSSELSITRKISSAHLTVCGAKRQKVKTSTKLFSHTTAQAITRATSLGYLEGHNHEESYKLFKLTNDWLDVMNVRVPYADARKRMHAYGLAQDVQDVILDQMTDLMKCMRVLTKTDLLPFQRGIIQSNLALKLLYEDLKSRFDVKYMYVY